MFSHIPRGKNQESSNPSSNILIRVARLAGKPKDEAPLLSFEPSAEERLGLLIASIRRRKKMSREELATRSRCTAETIIALEMGLLPTKDMGFFLPKVSRGLGMDTNFLEEMRRRERKTG